MKHNIVFAFIAALLISCGSPAAVPTIEPTREEPKKSAPIDIAIETATATTLPTETSTATYTPIPATFTLATTKDSRRSLKTPGVISGSGNEIIDLSGDLPTHLSVSSSSDIQIYFLLADGQRLPISTVVDSYSQNPIVAMQVVCSGKWTIRTSADVTTPTTAATATRKPTVIVRSAPTLAVIPTKKPTAVVIPTVFMPPTDVPPPPPAACCKHCTPGKSKACGDSCISIDKTCHQPPGCAC